MLNHSDSNLYVFLLYIKVIISHSFKVEALASIKNNFVDTAILEITQDALRVDQTHHFNMFFY